MAYYAHTGILKDKSDWQPLREHLLAVAVAALAAQMARPFCLDKAAYLAGLLHDLGKYTPEFQRRLTGVDVRVDHSTAGAAILLGDLAKGLDKGIAELVAYCIAGHHAGLPDRSNESASCLNRRIEAPGFKPDPIWTSQLAADTRDLAPGFTMKPERGAAAFQYSVMVRMIFSCLVDADFKDTETFYSALENRQVDRAWLPLQDRLPQFLECFETYMQDRSSTATALNRLRSDILAHVRARAAEKPGLFTLTVPTGGGKTLASLGFALDHARAHGHTRIIYAIPFTSIVDQTAEIFRGILGDDNVLEHHSAIDEEKVDPKERRESRDKLKLAMEDWAAPVVVTTNLQLFESLFAARASRARKVHNIANSIIILDEAQTADSTGRRNTSYQEVLMATGRRKSERSTRRKLSSPGRPPVWQRENLYRFWRGVAAGLSSEEAATEAGVSGPVGIRWFRSSGGMPPTHLSPSAASLTSRNLSFREREEIALECARGTGVRSIARKLGRSPSTISREIRRNSATRGGDFDYRAITAQWHADRAARRPKAGKLTTNPALRDYVQDRLAGLIATSDGIAFGGPVVVWKGRRAVHRQR